MTSGPDAGDLRLQMDLLKYMLKEEAVTSTKLADRLRQTKLKCEFLESKVLSMQAEIEGLKRANRPAEVEPAARRVKVNEPQAFPGVRDAKALENFLWDMAFYLGLMQVPEKDKVPIASTYLTGDAKLWWRLRCDPESNGGRPEIGRASCRERV